MSFRLMFLVGALPMTFAFAQSPSPLGPELNCPLPSDPFPEPIVNLPDNVPLPTPRPKPPTPKVPELPREKEATSTGVELLDRVLNKEEPSSLLPFWFNYPWAKIETPRLWTAYLAEALRTHGRAVLQSQPKDVELYCPNFKNLNDDQRLAFWMRMISAIMEQESTYNPIRTYHSVRVEWGLFSTGLMMLSLPSSTQARFGCSMIQSQDDLFRWRNNIDCSLKIMTYYMSEDQMIASHSGSRWMGLARYWEPFRDSRLKGESARANLLRYVKQNRLAWLEEGRSSSHPAQRDGVHRAAGERPMGRILRITNQMAFCPSGSPDDYEEAPAFPDILNPPLPTPRPEYPAVVPVPTPRPEPRNPTPPVVPPGCPPVRS